VLRLSVACRRRCTGCIVAKRCVLEQKLLLTTYRKSTNDEWWETQHSKRSHHLADTDKTKKKSTIT